MGLLKYLTDSEMLQRDDIEDNRESLDYLEYTSEALAAEVGKLQRRVRHAEAQLARVQTVLDALLDRLAQTEVPRSAPNVAVRRFPLQGR